MVMMLLLCWGEGDGREMKKVPEEEAGLGKKKIDESAGSPARNFNAAFRDYYVSI